MSKEIINIGEVRHTLNTNTGEIRKLHTIEVEEGSIVRVITPEQQEIIKEKELQKIYRKTSREELGDFYFIMSENQLGNLSAASAARLIFLCTYLNYDNIFMLHKQKPMSKNDIQKLLRLSQRTFYNFWSEICPVYIKENENFLKLNTTEICRGKIKNKKLPYRKLWIEQIRKLYLSTPITKHKHLGYIFNLLPYINIEYNIICWNPDERDLNNVQPMTGKELCCCIGYDYSKIERLRKIYRELTFKFKDNEEYFLTFVCNEKELTEAKMFVNPHVVYSGTNYKNVEILGAFVKKKTTA